MGLTSAPGGHASAAASGGDASGESADRSGRGRHPRVLGWAGTSALAMGGSNQSLFVLGALLATQGTAAVPLLIIGLLISWAAAPGWIELILMWPDRVGGIAATCAEAFRPYSPVLANLTGVCYWWGWVPTCGLTAILSSTALHEWYLPGVPIKVLATAIVLVFLAVNLCGVKWVVRLALPIAACSATLALASAVIPVISGSVDWHRAASFSLKTPFHGPFGAITSAMAGLYLIGFAAPAFEAAACHVGETRDPRRNVPRAMFVSGGIASLYFVVLPIIWLGTIGTGIGGDLVQTLGPTYAPLLGGTAKAVAVWFMVMNMFHGTLQPLAGASRTVSQLSDDGLLPRMLGRRNRFDVPWVATLATAGMSILFLQSGDPTWVIAAANLTYLIGIGLPSVAVWLLRRNAPQMPRPYRAPRGMIGLGLCAAGAWGVSMILGFEQFGLPTVLAGLGLAYSGSVLYAWRAWRERRASGAARVRRSLHFKLTGAMLAVMTLDGVGYLLAIHHVSNTDPALVTLLADIFVSVAILTIVLGLVLPGMIAHASKEVSAAADRLARSTIADLTRAMEALAAGELGAARARIDVTPVPRHSHDEVGAIAQAFNEMQAGVARAAIALDGAREGLSASQRRLARNLSLQAALAELGQRALETPEVDSLIADAVATLAPAMEIDIVAVLRRDPAGTLHLGAEAGPATGGAQARVDVDDAWLDELLAARSPLQAHGDTRLRLTGLAAAPRSSLTMPIDAGDGAWGLLTMQSMRAREFTADEIGFVHTATTLLSETIQRIDSLDSVHHQALHDPLTGLPNRALFLDRLEQALARTTRRDGAVAVLFLDLDHFKLVNDSLGHEAGDRVLRHVAEQLDRSLRPGDTVARFGGDEFLMICTELDGPEVAGEIAARLTEGLRTPMRLGGVEHRIATSIGIAVATSAGRSAEDMIREADAAMYRAKEQGRNRHAAYDDGMRARATSRLVLANDLPQALESGQIRVDYQPIMSLTDAGVRGAEALVRWRHPQRGDISPADFIPVAEETGMIIELGEFVLREACAMAVSWQDAARTPVSVNVSTHQVRHPYFPQVVAGILRETGLDPHLLHLEITESVLMEETEASIRCLNQLKALGTSLVLDDFGTGYSSLAYVKRFPLDTIKIDRGFVADLENQVDATIVEAIVHMALGLRLHVVAEGIETSLQARLLQELGCPFGQGWLWSPAVAGEQIRKMLAVPAAPR